MASHSSNQKKQAPFNTPSTNPGMCPGIPTNPKVRGQQSTQLINPGIGRGTPGVGPGLPTHPAIRGQQPVQPAPVPPPAPAPKSKEVASFPGSPLQLVRFLP